MRYAMMRRAPTGTAAASLMLLMLSGPAPATTPPSHNVTVPTVGGQTVVVEWEGVSPAGTAGGATSSCSSGTLEDSHEINLTVPAGTYESVAVAAHFHIEWTEGQSVGLFTDPDLVLTVLKDGDEVDSSDGGDPEENVIVNNPATGLFSAITCSFAASDDTPFRGRLTLTATALTGTTQPPPPPVPLPEPHEPRYLQQSSPAGIGDSTSGEMNIGFNPATGRFMLLHALQTMRLTVAEDLQDPVEPPLKLPESCPALWEDVSFDTENQETLDPILSTDEQTGRTFVSQLFLASSAYAFTDDDGESWTPGSLTISGAIDHQSLVSGPYVAGQGPSPAAQGYPNVVLYCNQSGVVAATTIGCTRSDDGGRTFGQPVVAAHDARDCPAGDRFIHGHIRFAPDGTIFVPIENCNNKQALMTSTDSGRTFGMRINPNATPPNGWMHSAVAVSRDGSKTYLCYVNDVGDVRVSVSPDQGLTWPAELDRSVSTPVGLKQGVFVAAVAGDADRAACGFIGTTSVGNYQAMDFPGVWYAYVATTYDGGQTWRTVIASPGNPVQGVGGVCTTGNQCTSEHHRNLLDFNEMVMDERGYPVYAYVDGCLGLCDIDPVNAVTYAGKAVLTRQVGGRGLLAALDGAEPAAPDRACLAGSRTALASTLNWSVPDHGGAAIKGYRIFRGTSLDGLTEIAAVGPAATYVDTTADPATAYFYKVRAANSAGDGDGSNAVLLEPSNVVPETPCVLPGVTVMRDGTGDAANRQAAYDIENVRMAEPADMPGKLAAVIKVASLQVVPPNTFWALRFKAPVDPANGASHYFVGLSTQGGVNRFVHGTSRVESAPGVPATVTTFTVAGDIDAASSVNADGTITLIADKATFGGLLAGDVLADMTATTRPITNSQGPIAGGAQDDVTGGGYGIVGEAFCGVEPPPPPPPPTGEAQAAGNNRLAGGMPAWTVLALGLIALRRRGRLHR